jgi:nicotinate-nucleotide pyrophosphorylase (carboxylating)
VIASDTLTKVKSTRSQRLHKALFRGDVLTVANSEYRRTAQEMMALLLRGDLAGRDLTVEALALKHRSGTAVVSAKESGVAGGLDEAALLLQAHGVDVRMERKDGDSFHAGDVLLHLSGDVGTLLSLERVVLNVLQRMSGVATAARNLADCVFRCSSVTRVVGTRKTPWGLLDKRALHLGHCGTHRLGLSDAILIKNNHLALLASREEDAVRPAIERAWALRHESAFIEVEVRGEAAARKAAQTFQRLQEDYSEEYPCLLLLDNMSPQSTALALDMLRRERLWESILVEASGGINDENLDAYATCGVDAISIGAITHSTRALDLSQTIS